MATAPSRSSEEVSTRVDELRHDIEQANYNYFVQDAPTVSDAEYDTWMRELRTLERSHPELQSPDSPTQRVAGEVSKGFEAYRHREQMLSLGNAFTLHELHAWYERISGLLGNNPPLVAEPKIDGLAISLTYDHGSLSVGATRGNGLEGENVTVNLKTLHQIRLRLLDSPPDLVEIRGEIYLPIAGFEKLNEQRAAEGLSLFANPRNSAAGSLRQLDPAVTKGRPLRLFAYALGAMEGAERPKTQTELLQQIREWGLPVNDLIQSFQGITEVEGYCERMLVERESLPYEIDGVVVKVDDIAAQSQLGYVGREPRWAIAFKFQPRQATTRLNEIRVNVGRTGSLNPYAVLEPVGVGGVIVSQATLHNEQDIQRKDIREGDRVIVHRAGDVIPQVVKPLVEDRTGTEEVYHLPAHCPSCNTAIVRNEDEAMAYCPNPECPARIYEQIAHFVSKGAMDIRGLGGRMVAALLESGLIRDSADIYGLSADELMTLPNIKDKSASNLVTAIKNSKTRPFKSVIFALGIRFVGDQNAEILAAAFPTIEELRTAPVEQLESVEGIGQKMAQSVHEWFGNEKNQVLVDRLKESGLSMSSLGSNEAAGPLSGVSFLLTGKMETITRGAAERALQDLGGRIAPGISKSVNYLIVGADPGSKLARAEKLGTAIKDEAWLANVLETGRLE